MMTETTENVKNENELKFCKHCGAKIPKDAVICTACGRQVEDLSHGNAQQPQIVINNDNSNVNTNTATATAIVGGGAHGKRCKKTTALVLCLIGFCGIGGLHKFYEGKILSGILYLCTCGWFCIGTIIDLIALLGKPSVYYV